MEYWPFYSTINELPYEERYKLENLIIIGIRFGENKPVPNLFLLPLLDECEQLYKGIYVGLANDTLVRAVVLNGTGDSPARLRTDEETEVHPLRAHETNEVVFGVKGQTILRLFVRKLIRSTGIDIMHQGYEGVTTYLNKLLFDLFALGLFLSNQSSVAPKDVEDARKVLNVFVKQFQDLYGMKYMTSNVHSSLHLADDVLELGPLWTHSSFGREDINGKLAHLVLSSKSAQLQMVNSLFMLMQTANLKDFLTEGSRVYNYCRDMNSPKKQLKTTRIDESLYLVGTLKKIVLEREDHEHLTPVIGNRNAFQFARFMKNKIVYTSEVYTREKATCSRFVKYLKNGRSNYGSIRYSFKMSNYICEEKRSCPGQFYAFVKKLQIIDNVLRNRYGISKSYIYQVSMMNQSEVINVKDLECVCFFMSVLDDDRLYISEPINTVETE
ncbi:hypothetical protein QAD02_003421 [Eretmocerus hayati]|uniref:Uncharacterized protein n=1 Tax=Eretmocerus hayati TaxID=131215 RepID=A0ACC2NPJ4_9HYME|nr:hypothetical protein QAD02_003421 [Eretmocerus hayati]